MTQRKTRNEKFTKRARIALIKKGWRVNDLASEVGKSRNAVSRTLNGEMRFPHVRELIECTLFTPVD
jgi:transcriptional regulator with XRE-family HTH domain